MRQYAISKSAHPKKPVIMDIECDAGCGVVPMRYRDKSFVNAMQWVIGLETFLLFDDPWRIFLTTDHPNGAPFFFYPHLIRLLMDKGFRDDMLQKINPDAQAQSELAEIADPRIHARRDRHPHPRRAGQEPRPVRISVISASARAGDITVYRDDPNREAMFATPEYVFKNGELVVKNGKVVKVVQGRDPCGPARLRPSIEKPLNDYFDRYLTVRMENFKLADEEIVNGDNGAIIVQPTAARVS